MSVVAVGDKPMVSIDGFILTRQWQDVHYPSLPGAFRGLQLCFWLTTAEGPLQVLVDGQPAVFFLPASAAGRAEALLQQKIGSSAKHPGLIPTWQIRALALKDFNHRAVAGIYFREQRTLYRAREILLKHGLQPLEADIQPTDRFLMERFVTGPMQLIGEFESLCNYRLMRNPLCRVAEFNPVYGVMSLDIETSMTGDSLYSIAAVLARSDGVNVSERRVMMVGEDAAVPICRSYLTYWPDEKALLLAFLDWFQNVDPDIIIGWNVINFDLRFLQRKADALGVSLSLGRDSSLAQWRQSREDNLHYSLTLPGRLVMDGIETLKSATYNFESFSLEYVSRSLLQRGKLTHDVDNRGAAISEQFLHDKPALAAYNLEDCQLVWDIFVQARLLEFAVERARLTGLAMDRFGGSVASFDNRYLPRLHRRGYVAPMLPTDPVGVGSPGGYVMNSQPGFYDHVLVLDFKSLYPSIIRTFHIDPLARVCARQAESERDCGEAEPIQDQKETVAIDREQLVPGFNGAAFLKSDALLPALIGELWQARDRAKRQSNSAMAQAIKIIMNSFYGVLGTPGCRFFDYRLPSSITLRGHQILNRSRELIEARGHQVIYGDTDSVFVCLEGVAGLSLDEIRQCGEQLAVSLNRWWADYLRNEYRIDSHLEIQFETHYSRFLMPTIRGTETGSKKRYAGLIEFGDSERRLVFKGLEAVRTDWTPLAREFQRELYRRIFMREPYEAFIRQTVADIRAGNLDDKLVFRKRIRRRLSDYKRNIPPHVQAARKAEQWLQNCGQSARYERGGWIRYTLTINGAEPLENLTSALDYDLLIERQIAPIVDAILQFLGSSFAQIADRQMGLFQHKR